MNLFDLNGLSVWDKVNSLKDFLVDMYLHNGSGRLSLSAGGGIGATVNISFSPSGTSVYVGGGVVAGVSATWTVGVGRTVDHNGDRASHEGFTARASVKGGMGVCASGGVSYSTDYEGTDRLGHRFALGTGAGFSGAMTAGYTWVLDKNGANE